ncbi:MAG: flagellar motor protein MotB [Paenibacillaceae bacterium]
MAKKVKAHDHEEHMDETWLIPYADLLTLLLALFIVLFASSSVDAHKFQDMAQSFNSVLSGGAGVFESSTFIPVGDTVRELGEVKVDGDEKKKSKEELDLQEKIQQETEQLENLKEKIDQYIVKNGLTAQLTTELNNFQLVLRISDNALFASGAATVKTEAQKLAVAISNLLVTYPQYEVIVSGHTDDRPINTAEFKDNWMLSWKRSYNFMDILLSNNKLDESRFSPVGYGEHRPIATNTTEAGRAANRRVEVSIIRTIIESPSKTLKVD